MHMALNADEWLRLNTSYCKRLSAWLSPSSCEANRAHSASGSGDLRCSGCPGLDNQDQAPNLLSYSLHSALHEVLDAEPVADHHCDEEDAAVYSFVDENAVEQELLQLFPELEEFIEETGAEEIGNLKLRAKVKPAQRKRWAVFRGRCPKCNGYMVNDIERYYGEKDDDIYRCFTCGWRVSPVYFWNRNQ